MRRAEVEFEIATDGVEFVERLVVLPSEKVALHNAIVRAVVAGVEIGGAGKVPNPLLDQADVNLRGTARFRMGPIGPGGYDLVRGAPEENHLLEKALPLFFQIFADEFLDWDGLVVVFAPVGIDEKEGNLFGIVEAEFAKINAERSVGIEERPIAAEYLGDFRLEVKHLGRSHGVPGVFFVLGE